MPLDVDFIPDDIWLTIFEHFGPADLSSLSSTCHKFHHLTQRLLLREITWSRASSAERNVKDWGTGGSLAQFTGIVRKVRIRLSFKKVNQNGALVTPVDWEFYDSVCHRLLSFPNLRSLELIDTILTPALYPVLAQIPSLRELNITRCIFIWSPLYPAILSTLGRPIPPGGIPDMYTVSRGDPSHVPAQTQWFLNNHSFDFAQQLSHITHLTFRYSRSGLFNEDAPRPGPEELPYPNSEINKPSVLHPLYLLSLPGLTDITLTWSSTLMQVYETLHKYRPYTNPTGGNNGGIAGVAGGVGAGAQVIVHPLSHHGPNAIAVALHCANPFGLNVFVPLRPVFQALRHVTLLVDDLSRDIMDSIVSLFEHRVNSPAPGLGPLRADLRVGKHTLTEQHIGSIQFRLPGVYHYEGPLAIAGLLAAGTNALNTANPMEEVRMTEAQDMNMILYTLERLPRTLKKLDIRMYKWDQEILYAVRVLFKGLMELVIRFGRGGLRENTHVILGSDILPELRQLHTLRMLPSDDCIKREQQQRYPFINHGSTHPAGNNGTWWAMSSNTGPHAHPNHHHHHPPAFTPHHHHHVPLFVPPPYHGHHGNNNGGSNNNGNNNAGGGGGAGASGNGGTTTNITNNDHLSFFHADFIDDFVYDSDDEDAFWTYGEMSDDEAALFLGSSRRSTAAQMQAAIAASSAALNGTGSWATQTPGAGSSSAAVGSSSASASAGPSTAGASINGATVGSASGTAAASSASGSNTNAAGGSQAGPSTSHSGNAGNRGRVRRGRPAPSRTFTLSAVGNTSSVSASTSTSSASSTSTSTSGASTSATAGPSNRPIRKRGRPAGRPAPTQARADSTSSNNTERMLTESDEQSRITESLKEDLCDYLVGWNRHCPALRVVQIEHDLTWVRRFAGDVWTPVTKSRAI